MAKNKITTEIKMNVNASIENSNKVIKEIDRILNSFNFGDKFNLQFADAKKDLVDLSKAMSKIAKMDMVPEEDLDNLNRMASATEKIISKVATLYDSFESKGLKQFSKTYLAEMERINQETKKIKQEYFNKTGKDYDKESKKIEVLTNRLNEYQKIKERILSQEYKDELTAAEQAKTTKELEKQIALQQQLLAVKKEVLVKEKTARQTYAKEEGYSSYGKLSSLAEGVQVKKGEERQANLSNEINKLKQVEATIKQIEKTESNAKKQTNLIIKELLKAEVIQDKQISRQAALVALQERQKQLLQDMSRLNAQILQYKQQQKNAKVALNTVDQKVASDTKAIVTTSGVGARTTNALDKKISDTTAVINQLKDKDSGDNMATILNQVGAKITTELNDVEKKIDTTNKELEPLETTSNQLTQLENLSTDVDLRRETAAGNKHVTQEIDNQTAFQTKQLDEILANNEVNASAPPLDLKEYISSLNRYYENESVKEVKSDNGQDVLMSVDEEAEKIYNTYIDALEDFVYKLTNGIEVTEKEIQNGLEALSNIFRADQKFRVANINLLYEDIDKATNSEDKEWLMKQLTRENNMLEARANDYFFWSSGIEKLLSKKPESTSSQKSPIDSNLFAQGAKDAQIFSNNLKQATDQTKFLGSAWTDLGNKMSYVLSLNFIFDKVVEYTRKAVTFVQDLDKDITQIALVLQQSSSDVWKNFDSYAKMAERLNTTVSDVVGAMKLFYQQGLSTAEVNKMVEASAVAAALGETTMAEASETLTSIINSYNLTANDALDVTDKISSVAIESAADFNEMSTAIEKVASSAASAGLDLDHMMGFLAKMIETTREAPTNIGTALKTIVANFSQFKEDPTSLTEDGTSINDVDEALRSVGVDLLDTEGNMRDLGLVIDDLGRKWDGLNRNTKAYLATTIAGTRQQSRFYAMMNDYDRTLELIATSSESAGQSTKLFRIYQDSLTASTKRLKNESEKFYGNLLSKDGIVKGFTDILTNLLKVINKIGPGLTLLAAIPIAKGIRGGVNAIGKLSMSLKDVRTNLMSLDGLTKDNVLNKITEGITNAYAKQGSKFINLDKVSNSTSKAMKKINKVLKVEDAVEDYNKLSEELKKLEDIQIENEKIVTKTNETYTWQGKEIKDLTIEKGELVIVTTAEDGAEKKLTLTRAQADVQQKQSIATNKIDTAVRWGQVAATLAYAAAMALLVVGTIAISKITKELSEAEGNRIKNLQEVANKSQEEADTLDELIDEYIELNSKMLKTIEDRERLIELSNEIAASNKDMVLSYDAEGNAILKNTELLKQLNEEKQHQAAIDKQNAATAIAKHGSNQAKDATTISIGGGVGALTGAGIGALIIAGTKFGTMAGAALGSAAPVVGNAIGAAAGAAIGAAIGATVGIGIAVANTTTANANATGFNPYFDKVNNIPVLGWFHKQLQKAPTPIAAMFGGFSGYLTRGSSIKDPETLYTEELQAQAERVQTLVDGLSDWSFPSLPSLRDSITELLSEGKYDEAIKKATEAGETEVALAIRDYKKAAVEAYVQLTADMNAAATEGLTAQETNILANRTREKVQELMNEGKTDEEIRKYLSSESWTNYYNYLINSLKGIEDYILDKYNEILQDISSGEYSYSTLQNSVNTLPKVLREEAQKQLDEYYNQIVETLDLISIDGKQIFNESDYKNYSLKSLQRIASAYNESNEAGRQEIAKGLSKLQEDGLLETFIYDLENLDQNSKKETEEFKNKWGQLWDGNNKSLTDIINYTKKTAKQLADSLQKAYNQANVNGQTSDEINYSDIFAGSADQDKLLYRLATSSDLTGLSNFGKELTLDGSSVWQSLKDGREEMISNLLEIEENAKQKILANTENLEKILKRSGITNPAKITAEQYEKLDKTTKDLIEDTNNLINTERKRLRIASDLREEYEKISISEQALRDNPNFSGAVSQINRFTVSLENLADAYDKVKNGGLTQLQIIRMLAEDTSGTLLAALKVENKQFVINQQTIEAVAKAEAALLVTKLRTTVEGLRARINEIKAGKTAAKQETKNINDVDTAYEELANTVETVSSNMAQNFSTSTQSVINDISQLLTNLETLRQGYVEVNKAANGENSKTIEGSTTYKSSIGKFNNNEGKFVGTKDSTKNQYGWINIQDYQNPSQKKSLKTRIAEKGAGILSMALNSGLLEMDSKGNITAGNGFITIADANDLISTFYDTGIAIGSKDRLNDLIEKKPSDNLSNKNNINKSFEDNNKTTQNDTTELTEEELEEIARLEEEIKRIETAIEVIEGMSGSELLKQIKQLSDSGADEATKEHLEHFYNYLKEIERVESDLLKTQTKLSQLDLTKNYNLDLLSEENRLLGEKYDLLVKMIPEQEVYLQYLQKQLTSGYGKWISFDKHGDPVLSQTDFVNTTEAEKKKYEEFDRLKTEYENELQRYRENSNSLYEIQNSLVENITKTYDKLQQQLDDEKNTLSEIVTIYEHRQDLSFRDAQSLKYYDGILQGIANTYDLLVNRQKQATLEAQRLSNLLRDKSISKWVQFNQSTQNWELSDAFAIDLKNDNQELIKNKDYIQSLVASYQKNKELQDYIEQSTRDTEAQLRSTVDNALTDYRNVLESITEETTKIYDAYERTLSVLEKQNEIFGHNTSNLQEYYDAAVNGAAIAQYAMKNYQDQATAAIDNILDKYEDYVVKVGDSYVINKALSSEELTTEQIVQLEKMIAQYEILNKAAEDSQDQYLDYMDTIKQLEETKRDAIIEIMDQLREELENLDQKELDDLEKKYSEMDRLDNEYYSSLSQKITDARKKRDRQQSVQNVSQLRNQIAVLERDSSGAFSTELRDLRQQLITQLQEQADQNVDDELERIEREQEERQKDREIQITQMENLIDFKIENGMYWDEAYTLWESGRASIESFLASIYSEQDISKEEIAQKIDEANMNLDQAFVKYGNINAQVVGQEISKIQETLRTLRLEVEQPMLDAMNKTFDKVEQVPDVLTQIKEVLDKIYSQEDSASAIERMRENGNKWENASTAERAELHAKNMAIAKENGWTYESSTGTYYDKYGNAVYNATDETKYNAKYDQIAQEAADKMRANGEKWNANLSDAEKQALHNVNAQIAKPFGWYYEPSTGIWWIDKKKKQRVYDIYENGGYVDYTGFAKVDGTPSKPEAFLNAQQTQLFEQLRDSLAGKKLKTTTNDNNSEGDNIIINNLEISVKEIADADSIDKVVKTVKQSIYKDATATSGITKVSRR